jgi:hypothetical protein
MQTKLNSSPDHTRHNINNINNTSLIPTYPARAAIDILAFALRDVSSEVGDLSSPNSQPFKDWTIKGLDDKRIGRDKAATYRGLADL